MNWKTVAVSAIGSSHLKNKLPCQDYAAVHQFSDEIIIGAVADGAGSARHAD